VNERTLVQEPCSFWHYEYPSTLLSSHLPTSRTAGSQQRAVIQAPKLRSPQNLRGGGSAPSSERMLVRPDMERLFLGVELFRILIGLMRKQEGAH
jgi:hypothetical protein